MTRELKSRINLAGIDCVHGIMKNVDHGQFHLAEAEDVSLIEAKEVLQEALAQPVDRVVVVSVERPESVPEWDSIGTGSAVSERLAFLYGWIRDRWPNEWRAAKAAISTTFSSRELPYPHDRLWVSVRMAMGAFVDTRQPLRLCSAIELALVAHVTSLAIDHPSEVATTAKLLTLMASALPSDIIEVQRNGMTTRTCLLIAR